VTFAAHRLVLAFPVASTCRHDAQLADESAIWVTVCG